VTVEQADGVAAEVNEASGTLFGQKVCFIASPIGANGSPERKRSNLVKTYIIDEALNPLGYQTRRADEIDKSGEITTQIVGDLIEADLLIADLTGHNANVFYELAIRHSFRKPYIQLIEEGEDIPFDVRAYRTVFVNHKDLESAAKARESLQKMVRDIEGGAEIQSPVTHAVNRQQLEQSQDPRVQEMAQIGQAVERIDLRLRKMEGPVSRRPSRRELAIRRMLMDFVTTTYLRKQEIDWDDLKRLREMNDGDPALDNLLSALEDVVPPF
jgi:hypothetical protein